MCAKVEQNKIQKEVALQQAAYDLFNTAGVNNTTVDDIVKRAGVAKGTFYLYFKDKYDILERITLRKTSALVREAILVTHAKPWDNQADRILCFINYIIDSLVKDRLLMRIIYKNLSSSLFRKALNDPKWGEFQQVVKEFKQSLVSSGYSAREMDELLFILLEMTGSVCYSAIINGEPGPIEEIRPMLLKTIRKILE